MIILTNTYKYRQGGEIVKLKMEDKIIDYISLEGNNTISAVMSLGQNFTYSIFDYFKFIENNKMRKELYYFQQTIVLTLLIFTN